MKILLLTVATVLMIVGAIMVVQQPAYAYADPGTGLLAIQAVGSALAATGWFLRKKIYDLFHRDQKKYEPQAEAAKNDQG